MSNDTDRLIASLGAGLPPVTPLAPPALRAAWFLLLVGALAAWPVLGLSNLPLFTLRVADPRTALECAASLLTGIVATLAAFHLSVPGRDGRWAAAPLAPLCLWIGAAGAGCLRHGFGRANWDCVAFVLVTGIPLAWILMAFLRRARPLAPIPVALAGGLGAAGIAAFLLQFFHPFDVTVMDLLLHTIAVVGVLTVARLSGRRALG